jgi:hypothetical protein
MKRLLLAGLALCAVGQAQPLSGGRAGLQLSTAQILPLLQGNVDLIGDQFGSTEFQRGLLRLAQARRIKVRVLTSVSTASNMKPLRAVGAQIFTVNARFTNAMVVVRGARPLVIFPGRTTHLVIQNSMQAAQIGAVVEGYWGVGKLY